MAVKSPFPVPQNPLILRSHRLMDAFAKSDDERDFYLDRVEGFIIFVDLDKGQEDLDKLKEELTAHKERYSLIPKLTFYETKKIMEGFVNEKVYDIDTKEKLLEVIQSKDAREHFLEFIYDHDTELEKWQQYYQERSRVRIIEWLRNNNFQFVFEEDLELPRQIVEKLKLHLFDIKVPKEVASARQTLITKAKTYYSNEALNPRPKRGRPPKQVIKIEVETQVTTDMYTQVPPPMRQFLYIPDIANAAAITFSERFDTEEEFLANLRNPHRGAPSSKLDALSQKFATLQQLSNRFGGMGAPQTPKMNLGMDLPSFDEDDEDEDEDEFGEEATKKSAKKAKTPLKKTTEKTTEKKAPKKK